MDIKHESSKLISALRNLYFRVSELELIRRTSVYQNRASADMVSDISTLLASHLDKIANESQKTKGVVSSISEKPVKNNTQSQQVKKSQTQVEQDIKELDGLAKHYKESAAKNEQTNYLGEKLKSSTWSHLQSALMHARLGDGVVAKLHADIADQSLKEAAHYMDIDDYKMLTKEITSAIQDLKHL